MTEHQKWLQKYKRKLIYAWKMGFDNDVAAERLHITENEIEEHLAIDDSLRALRRKNLDELLEIAKNNIAQKIKDGDRQACEWYLEHRDPQFGAKGIKQDFEVEDSIEEKKQEMEDFMDGFRARPDQFDGK